MRQHIQRRNAKVEENEERYRTRYMEMPGIKLVNL